jgi:hypothetical protein
LLLLQVLFYFLNRLDKYPQTQGHCKWIVGQNNSTNSSPMAEYYQRVPLCCCLSCVCLVISTITSPSIMVEMSCLREEDNKSMKSIKGSKSWLSANIRNRAPGYVFLHGS